MDGLQSWQQSFRGGVFALIATGGLTMPVPAGGTPMDEIRVSRTGDVSTTEIELGCAMRYLDHTPSDGGIELRVRLALGFDCRNTLRGTLNTLRRPRAGRLSHLSEIEFDAISADKAMITLRFERPVAFEVRQTSNEYLLTVIVDTGRSTPLVAPPVPPVATTESVPSPRTPADRGPSHRVQRQEPRVRDRFVIRLSDAAVVGDADLRALQAQPSFILYTEQVAVAGRTWTELRLGFFDTEAAAIAALAELGSRFPDAWVSIARHAEQTSAARQPLPAVEQVVPKTPDPPHAAGMIADDERPTLTEERITDLMVEARAAMLRAEYDRAVKIYSRLLEGPVGLHRPEAREFLGVARQKNRQLAHARAEFEVYLSEFPDGPDANRVRQRLAALADSAGRAVISVERPVETTAGWDHQGSVSQFYLHGVNLSRDDEADVVTQSALLSQVVVAASRRGERIDVSSRANVGFLYDFSGDRSGNQGMVSFAYFDINDTALDLGARVGRQTRHRAGVLGRFDGANLQYRVLPDLSVNVTAGFPVDSPRYRATTDRFFYGASVELENVADAFDFSVFSNLQKIDGIWDRQAFGAEAQYHTTRLNLVGLLDYDASYNVLNSGLIFGTWRVNDRLTFHGRYRGGTSPYLTTRNAIIGQPVRTVEALLESYSEGQVRRLARNRTAEARSGSAGLSAEVTQRLHLNFDSSYFEYGSTVASGGVEAVPATGPQYVHRVDLLGSSLLKQGDSVILGYRRFESRSLDSDTVIFDLRYPVGMGLRINPRLAVTLEDRTRTTNGAVRHLVARPMLRVLYRGQRNFRVEFEFGGQWSDQQLPSGLTSPFAPDGNIESSAYYAHLGYWLDFR